MLYIHEHVTKNHTEFLHFTNICRFPGSLLLLVYMVFAVWPHQFFTNMRPTYNHRILWSFHYLKSMWPLGVEFETRYTNIWFYIYIYIPSCNRAPNTTTSNRPKYGGFLGLPRWWVPNYSIYPHHVEAGNFRFAKVRWDGKGWFHASNDSMVNHDSGVVKWDPFFGGGSNLMQIHGNFEACPFFGACPLWIWFLWPNCFWMKKNDGKITAGLVEFEYCPSGT